jgi:hypothetical protein
MISSKGSENAEESGASFGFIAHLDNIMAARQELCPATVAEDLKSRMRPRYLWSLPAPDGSLKAKQ